MKRRFAFVCGLALIACSLLAQGPTQLPTPNPIIGVWKQNMEKSTYSPGPPPPRGVGSVRQYAAGLDGSIVAVTFNISATGLPSLGAISAANYDGKDYPQHTIATQPVLDYIASGSSFLFLVGYPINEGHPQLINQSR